jgi:hexosaminidase
MSNKFILFILSFYYSYCLIIQKEHIFNQLWPTPNKIDFGNSTLTLNKQCKFKFSPNINSELIDIVLSLYHDIINIDKGDNIFKSFIGIGSCKFDIKVNIKYPEMKNYTLDYSPLYESYIIDISADFVVKIEATYLNGLVRALETFSQVLHLNGETQHIEVYSLPLRIEDYPRFAYRGVMIDTSRQYISVGRIKEIVRGMMYNKLNVLHWHLTDDEYFSFKSSIDIVTVNTKVYSKDEIKELIEYAYYRGITIVPEIDNPSHTRSWILDKSKYKEAITISKQEYGTLNPSMDLTYDIVDRLLTEVIDTFAGNEDRRLIHVGGDEVLSTYWERDDIKEFMKQNNLTTIKQLENYYFNRVGSKLPTSSNYIYWVDNNSEVYDIYNKENSILMYWGLNSKLTELLDKFSNTKQKYIILTPGDILYLDCGVGNKYGDKTWCGEYKTWKDVYKISLLDKYNQTAFNVLGYQATLFGELADENSIVGKIFPRAVALAERLWLKIDVIDIKSAFMRLLIHNKRLNDRGVHSISITSQFCESYPLECIDKIK